MLVINWTCKHSKQAKGPQYVKSQRTFRRLVRQFWHPVRLRTMSVFLARFDDCSIERRGQFCVLEKPNEEVLTMDSITRTVQTVYAVLELSV